MVAFFFLSVAVDHQLLSLLDSVKCSLEFGLQMGGGDTHFLTGGLVGEMPINIVLRHRVSL